MSKAEVNFKFQVKPIAACNFCCIFLYIYAEFYKDDLLSKNTSCGLSVPSLPKRGTQVHRGRLGGPVKP